MNPASRRIRRFTIATSLFALASMITLAACSDDSNGGGTTADYEGTFASNSVAGRLAFGGSTATARAPGGVTEANVPRATMAVTGTMTFINGSVINLTGTLEDLVLTLTGGGYTFAGTQSGNVISGTFTGPAEPGIFTASLTTDNEAVKVLCGEYLEDAVAEGYFNLALAPSRNGGVIVVPYEGGGAQLGKARPKAGTTDQVEVTPDALPTFVIATGTLTNNGNNIAGTWDDGDGSSGTFSGSVTDCSAPAEHLK